MGVLIRWLEVDLRDFFMIFDGFSEFGWILGNVENMYLLTFSGKLGSGRIMIVLKQCGIYKRSIETRRRPPFRVCGATTPCAAPAPERGVLARVVPQSVAQGSAFGLQGGGALKWSRSLQS